MTRTPVALRSREGALHIDWSDGTSHRIPFRALRDGCPCASCRDQPVRPAAPPPGGLLPVISAAEARPLTILSMRPAGNYAYGIEFSDGHSTGIYTFERLFELGEQCRYHT